MLLWMIASLSVAPVATTPAPLPTIAKPVVQCREIGSAYSRSEAIVICRTKAQWEVRDACQGATRYCSPEEKRAMLAGLPGGEGIYAADEDSRIVCRKLSITGSRLRATSTCLSQREWRRLYDDTQVELKELQNTFSKKGPF